MNKTRRIVYISIFTLLLGGALLDYFQGQDIADALANVPGLGNIIASSVVYTSVSTTTNSTNLPGVQATSTPAATVPLNSNQSASRVITTIQIFTLTNVERSTVAGLPPLKENALLDVAAETKLKDMFAKQYFAHISPSGVGPGDLAEQAGYSYVVEGENLAEGNFLNAQNLLDAWMASPGHRANILNTRYTDIGVAVGEGMYQGQEVWMAVQEFGKPLSSCPVVDVNLHQAIITNQMKTTELSQELNTIKQALIATATGTPNENVSYNQIANHYNDDVDIYNSVVIRLKAEIAAYNQQVDAFNLCING